MTVLMRKTFSKTSRNPPIIAKLCKKLQHFRYSSDKQNPNT
ncbi:hypothetical protein APHNP_0334 [Anaplasma phagocytophilum str. ApNP]|uniref:Uncharacterized protein n=1 Tax=Anaplasma phagocytophilum str. ApNP TaxID=1359153 RepID=A0A0F3NG47_ANAPH|nr:hypothetical protein APHNP_0334 [Anaplasma phagocytophilum str. ApNP]